MTKKETESGQDDVPGLEKLGTVTFYRNAEGKLYFSGPVSPGGRPRQVERDISLTMHFLYLTKRGLKIAAAHAEVGKMFGLHDVRNIQRIIKETRETYIDRFHWVFCRMVVDEKTQQTSLTLFATESEEIIEHGARGLVVTWGDLKARVGTFFVGTVGFTNFFGVIEEK